MKLMLAFIKLLNNYENPDKIPHRLNMELDLQSLFGLHVTWSAQLFSLAESPQSRPFPAFGLVWEGRYWSIKIGDISL